MLNHIPVVTAHHYRKAGAACVSLRDPFKTLRQDRHHPRPLDNKKQNGILTLYCDGNHVYADMTYFSFIFDGYGHRVYYHPGLHLVPRKIFKKTQHVRTGSMSGFWLRHDGYTGKPGIRTAKLWFETGSQFSKPWELELKPGQIVNLIVDDEDWHLETLWLRERQKVRRSLLKRSRHVPVTH